MEKVTAVRGREGCTNRYGAGQATGLPRVRRQVSTRARPGVGRTKGHTHIHVRMNPRSETASFRAAPPATSVTRAAGRTVHRRRLRNLLLDPRFQLKFTAYAVGMALGVAALLAGFLWTATQALVREAEAAVDARSSAAVASRELANRALGAELARHDGDPAVAARVKAQVRLIDDHFLSERAVVQAQHAEVRRRVSTLWTALGASLVAFVLAVAAAALVVTHKVVGPVYRVKQLAQQVGDGHFRAPTHALRDGDELRDLFQSIASMVERLRMRQALELAELDAVLLRARDGQVPAAGVVHAVDAQRDAVAAHAEPPVPDLGGVGEAQSQQHQQPGQPGRRPDRDDHYVVGLERARVGPVLSSARHDATVRRDLMPRCDTPLALSAP